MESNTNNFGNQPSSDAAAGSFDAGGGPTSNAGTTGGGSGGFSRDAGTDAGGLTDRARNVAGTASDRLADVGSTVRDKAGNLKNTLADALESGAERLRAQGAGGGQTAANAATGGAAGMLADAPQLGAAANQLAGGLQASADWLRDADFDGVKSGIERQVKEHPGRSLAVAVGLGYLIGKAFKK